MTEEVLPMAEGICRAHPDELTAGIVSAYVSNNAVALSSLPELIETVRAAIGGGAGDGAGRAVRKPTAAEIKKSVTNDALISFIDGKPYKTLKRHLTKNGLTVEQYRNRYGLPDDYPVVSPGYSEKRSQLAKQIGLGNHSARAAAA